MDFTVVIPARYASSRLPGKPLADIGGKPMIQHVVERAQASSASRVVVATDDARIEAAVQNFGAEVIMTSDGHPSGTDRLQEVAQILELDDEAIVVNVQGDEPLIPPELIDQVASNLASHEDAGIATLCERIHDPASVFDPNVVKVVFDQQGFANYFSRAPIPWSRSTFSEPTPHLASNSEYYRHIGIYAYRVDFLNSFVVWSPSMTEVVESLEQLRALTNGVRIHVDVSCCPPAPGVDTEADLQRVRDWMAEQGSGDA